MNTIHVENCKTLFIGRRGENEVTEVVFDFSEWQEQFGAGVIDLYVKRNLDVDAYPVVLSVDGTVATWIVTAADTDVVGNGKIEFVYTVDQKVAKSAVFPFFVGEDIGESSPEPPEHYQSWLEQLTELGTETQANAQAAAQSASEAAESAAQVAEDSNNAEAWAVGERNGEPVSEDDPTYNNNAKYWAENARANAPVQSVNGEDGDVVLTLDNIPNGETYARATPEQIAQIATNAENIASIGAIADTALQPEDLTPYRTAAQQNVIDNGLNSKINGNIGRIADINAKIPLNASTSNKLVDQNSLDSKLSDYRTAARQDIIDNNKQTKITANGILKGNGLGGISAAVAGMDYLPTSALAAYRTANAQDAIDNAQNENINKNTAAINTMQPAATAADIGKALIVKTVADGKPTSYEYGEAGGGGSALTAGDGIDLTNDVISNTQGIEYIVGTQTAATAKWTGESTDETLKVGKIIAYYLPFAGTSTAATLALTMAGGTTTREISLQYKPNFSVTTQFPAGSIIILVYDGTYWRVNASYDTDTNTYPTGYCVTNGSVAAKSAACSFGYRGDANYFPCLFRFANTATDATLAITTYAPEAAPIYVNGQRTSATNTFSAGVILFLYYNGAYYCYNDGRFPILVDGAVTSVQEYATGLLADYRTAADQDLIDNGKQAKITASGILKGDGAGGVSAAVAGVDYLKSAPVTSVNGQTGDVTIQTATDAQVTTAVNTWLGENVAQETGYVLDASLTMNNAAPPASAVGDLKSAFSLEPLALQYTSGGTGFVKYANGDVGTSSLSSHTDYIDISDYPYLYYKRQGSNTNNPTAGMAFYDENKSYIAGEAALGRQSQSGYLPGLKRIAVPTNAKYARFSMYTDETTYGTFEVFGETKVTDRINRIDEMQYALGSAVTTSKKDYIPQRGLVNWSLSYSTGGVTTNVTNGKYCSTGMIGYHQDILITLGLDEYEWYCWSYCSPTANGNQTHSNTNNKKISGETPIAIKWNTNDSYLIVGFNRKDLMPMSTDLADPDSDYAKIKSALKVYPLNGKLDELYDGYIFRLQSNPDPIPIGENALGYEQFITQTWDTLLADYPDNVTKSVVMQSSTTSEVTTAYNIYSYVFEPRNASFLTKTVFLSAGCHGNEYEGFWGLYRLMRMIYDEGYKYPNLRKFRNNVRFVIVPVWNPWGVENRVRNCPLGFPANDNLNKSVTVDGTTYPAFACNESRAIKAIIDQYETSLSLWVDIHTDPNSLDYGTKKGCYGYAVQRSPLNNALYGLTVDFHNIIKAETNYSTNITIYDTESTGTGGISGYGNYRNIPAALIEVSINEFAQSGTATLMKYAQEWYGNVIAAFIAVT